MTAEFERVGVRFERVQAVDGSALSAAAQEDFGTARTAAKPEGWLPGEIGCFLSHLSVWRQIAAGDEGWAAVFEDDVRLAGDILSGGRNVAAAPGRKIHRALSGTPGSAGYLIARHVAKQLVESSPETHSSVDVFLFKPRMSAVARALRRYQVVPALCIQDEVLRRGACAQLKSEIRARSMRGRGYRERLNPLLRIWPIQRHAVPFQP